MRTTRTFATICLALSSCAFFAAASDSWGEQPGVIRMTSGTSAPQPPEGGSTFVPAPQPDFNLPPGNFNPNGSAGAPLSGQPSPPPGQFSQPFDYTPYMEPSAGATESPVLGRRPVDNPLFGPILMFESNIGDGLGYEDGWQRLNARLPWHVVPGNSVLMGDLSASLTNEGRDLYNFGLIWRNYDDLRNRIFGWNVYGDIDEGRGNTQRKRVGFGMESLGRYLDFMANGYVVAGGDESILLTDNLIGPLTLAGNNAFRIRNQTRDNAYSGGDFEVGGPLPLLGRRGMNMYLGAYYLDSEWGEETLGMSARWQAHLTESATVDFRYTNDDTFGVNSWASISYSIPNYRERAILQPRRVRDRLSDPVYRSNRIHTNVDIVNVPEAVIRAKTGAAWNISYVDPNRTAVGVGTLENPYNSLQLAAANNNAGIDIIRVVPTANDSNTNLTVNGGLDLFDCQVLLSSTKDFTLFTENSQPFFIPGTATTTGLGPLVSDPTMVAGGSVIRLANENTIVGMRIDASNAAGTVFGTGVSNVLPVTDVNLTMNTFTNYTVGADLQDVTGYVVADMNTFQGLAGASQSGLVLTTANNSTTDVLVRNNTANNNSVAGISVTANPGATINADNPNAFESVVGVPENATGIVGNRTTNGGTGLQVVATPGSTINAVVQNNTSTGNTFDGFVARSNNATFNLASLRGNTFSSNLQNGAFLHYQNGGIFRATTEDLNGDGILDAAEDINGNGLLDEGIVGNSMNNNSAVGLCLFGEDASTGVFDIGGPIASLGNTFTGNLAAGVAVDLRDTATAQIDALFNTVQGGSATPGLTIVLDFIDPTQGPVVDALGRTVNPFNVTNYGFAASDFGVVTTAIADTMRGHYRDILTTGQNALSPIPDGMELALDFVIGDAGVAPSNGATEYYAVTLGDSAVNLGGLAGQTADIGNIRNAQGQGPGQGLAGRPLALGGSAASLYTNQIVQFSPLLNPPNAINNPDFPEPIIVEDPSQSPQFAIDALTSGNLTFTRRAIGLVASHELGHSLSLRHILQTGRVTPTGLNAIMGTPAQDSPLQSLLQPAEFAISGTNPGELPGEAPFQQFDIAQLSSAIGLRVAAGETRNGFTVSGTNNSRLLASTFNNNRIVGASDHGINIEMRDTARAEGLTIQGNTITNGRGIGVRLAADGGAFIDADNTIGGTANNTYRGQVFTQSNTITGNAGDGFQALASNGGTIHGNLLNNRITDNLGSGASLQISNGGYLDFGTPASNRIISGNTITGNRGAGIQLVSNVTATADAQLDAVVRGNTISGNAGGGIVTNLNGPNNPMAPTTNNRVNLTVGGPLAAHNNNLDGNADVGVGAQVTGNGKLVFDLRNTSISGTTNGINPDFDGDAISLQRNDSALLLATIDNVTASGNAGNGLDVQVQGNDKSDPNQPMSGTVNNVAWTNNNFSSNGQNGTAFRVFGDAQLIANGTNNVVNNNTLNGILVHTSESGSFGDATVGLPPGQRVIFDGTVANGNRQDGLNILATEDSRVLLEVTSTRIPGTTAAHAALNTNGDSSFSTNGRDGIHIETTGGASDILITSGTGNTIINGNGTVAGGNGIRWNASGDSDGIVRVNRTTITNNIAGASEDTNGNGVLDAGEDLNANGDIDVADGDGIQYNVTDTATATLIAGGVGAGNIIQNNQDDGVAITARGSGINVSRPVISLVENTIGGQRNGIAAGNLGDGVSMNIFGGTDVGFAPGQVDNDFPFLTFNDGVVENGPFVQLSMTNNVITYNDERGVNLLLHGAAGERFRENNLASVDPVRVTLTGNTISSNGDEGIYYRADSDMNQSRFVYLANPTIGPPNARVLLFNNLDYSPFRPEFTNLNNLSVNGNSAYLPPYLNLRTVQNSFLTVTGNTIQNNGTNTITGEGMFLEVGTGAYVAADVRNNTFGGNLEEDFHTQSFLSAGNSFTSVEDTVADSFDFVYLDDTAQLDLRFSNNSGNQIDVTSAGATYTNFDPLKATFLGNLGVVNRQADLFQVDDGNNLNNPNNTFINFGVTQGIQGEFATGGYNLRAIADPFFPNLGFPPFLP